MQDILNRHDGVGPGVPFLITKHDSTNATRVTRGLAWKGAGAVKVTTPDGTDVVIADGVLTPGVIHPLRVVRVWDTGTGAGATDFVGFW